MGRGRHGNNYKHLNCTPTRKNVEVLYNLKSFLIVLLSVVAISFQCRPVCGELRLRKSDKCLIYCNETGGYHKSCAYIQAFTLLPNNRRHPPCHYIRVLD